MVAKKRKPNAIQHFKKSMENVEIEVLLEKNTTHSSDVLNDGTKYMLYSLITYTSPRERLMYSHHDLNHDILP